MSKPAQIPFYDIYGLPTRPVEPRFIHVETVSARAQLHHGRVRPHRHDHLHQLSLWTVGAGRYHVDDRAVVDFAAPFLCVMPAGTVHGFEAEAGSDALVVSLSGGFFADIGATDRMTMGALDQPLLVAPGEAAFDLTSLFLALEREYLLDAPGRDEALAAYVKLALVHAQRLRQSQAAEVPPSSTPNQTQARLLGAFRNLLEAHFAEGWSVSRYVDALGTTPYLLNAAVREGLGRSVLAAIHARRLTEAKRLLLYSGQTIAQVAFNSGFADPAYFSRFFRAQVGSPPVAWREQILSGRRTES